MGRRRFSTRAVVMIFVAIVLAISAVVMWLQLSGDDEDLPDEPDSWAPHSSTVGSFAT